jgi:hypothetical protein
MNHMHEQPENLEAWEALQAIPPDLPREDWHRAGTAAIAANLTIDDLVEWSRPASNFKSEQDVRAAFRTIKPDGGTGAATLFYMAKQHGWTSTAKPAHTSAEQGLMKLGSRLSANTNNKAQATPQPQQGDGALNVWERCVPATHAHPYIVAKGGRADGLRVVPAGDPLRIARQSMVGALVLPLSRQDGSLTSLTFILPPNKSGKSTKLNLSGAKQEDGRFILGKLSSGCDVYLCEGIGQAWACYQATGSTSVVCFSWGRVQSVAESIRHQDDSARLVLVPDVGMEAKAEEVAEAVGASVARMPEGWPQNSDVNDLVQRDGLPALVQILAAAVPPQKEPHPLARFVEYGMEPKPPEFIIPNLVDHGVVTFAGGHGVGKTSTLLPLAMVAAGLHHPNDPLGPMHWRHVVYVCEDVAQAKRIIAGTVRFGGMGLDEDTVRERLHLVEARRLPPAIVAQVGKVYRSDLTRTVGSVEVLPLVVLDTNAAVLDLDDSNANSEISRAMAQLKQGFAGLPIWLVCHVAKAVKNRTEASELSALGGVAFEADSVQNLYLVKEEKTDLRYLVLGKCRFERQWSEMEIRSHHEVVASRDEHGHPVQLTLRWNTVHPPEKSRKEAAYEALEASRKSDDGNLRDEIRAAVQIAWQRGFPLNKEQVKVTIRRNRATVGACIEKLLAEVWLHEVPIPPKERTNPKRSAFLVDLSTEEHEAALRGEGLPPDKLKVPANCRKPDNPPLPGNGQGQGMKMAA